jgi:uncharacterized protein
MMWPSLQGEDDLEFTNRVANVWKVKDDKALMLFVFQKEHKLRIQVGYGLEAVVTDAYSSRVIRETIVPYFRQGQYAAGLNAGVDQLASKIDPTFSGAVQQQSQPVQRPVSRSTPGPSVSDIVILAVLFLVFLFVIVPMLRGCGGCGGCFLPFFWGGGGGTTFGGGGFGGGGGGGGGWGVGGSWGGGGGSSFGGGGAGGSW